MRTLFFVLFLAVSLSAQGADPRLDRALEVETDPRERIELLDGIVTTDGGAKVLAERGLRADLAPEVVHAVVGALVRSGRHVAHLERIVRLLDDEKHRRRVLHRLQEASDGPQGAELVEELGKMARGITAAADKEVALRTAAVRALGQVPRRRALELIVEVWQRADEAPAVRAECREAVGDVLATETADEAAARLRANPFHGYHDFERERIRTLEREVERLRPYKRKWLLKAPADEALATLAQGDDSERRIAAQRLATLAGEDAYAPLEPAAFAVKVLDAAYAERDRRPPSPETLATLIEALRRLWGSEEPGPLRTAPDDTPARLLELVQPLAAGGRGREPVGDACLGLLFAMRAQGMTGLADFARRFDSADVRRKAIQSLGNLVNVVDDAGKSFIRDRLVDLLVGGEKAPPVRAQLLFSLAEGFDDVPPKAQEVVRELLGSATGEGEGALPTAEIRSCVKILRKAGTDEAFALLLELTRSHESAAVRRVAIETGLLPWAARNGKSREVFAHLRTLALDPEAAPATRTMVIKALADSGARAAHAVLVDLAGSQELEPAQRTEARLAKLVLGRALVRNGRGQVTKPDLDTALRILEEERDASPELAQTLAQQIVAAAEQGKLEPRQARYRIATAHMAHKPDDEERILQLLAAAADSAERDGLRPALEIELLRELVTRLEKAEDHLKATRRCKRLAELEKATPRAEAGWLLRAADNALRAKDAAAAKECLERAEQLDALDEAGRRKLAELKRRAAGG